MLILQYDENHQIKINNQNSCSGEDLVCRLALFELGQFVSYDGDPHMAYADAIQNKRISTPFTVVKATVMELYNPKLVY